jgi:hypothetical protein
MASIGFHDTVHHESAVRIANPFALVASAFGNAIARFEERRLIVRLSRLPAHIVRDMGFDPEKVADELARTWDDPALRLRRR